MWDCSDSVSAGTGEMRKRYGFVYVDRDDEETVLSRDLRRIPSTGIKMYRITG